MRKTSSATGHFSAITETGILSFHRLSRGIFMFRLAVELR
jgi:hypothetical protein